MKPANRFAFVPDLATAERASRSLLTMDRFGVLCVFTDAQGDAAVLELGVGLVARRRQEDHYGAFDVILLRFHPLGAGVFSCRGDRQFPFALQQLQRVGGLLDAFFFGDG